jgi:hypothetical protein
MAQRIDDASKSRNNLKYGGPETTNLVKEINKASRSLAANVTQMTNDLNSFVSVLEKAQVAVEKERSLVDRILRWLKSLFKAIAEIIATYAPIISESLRYHPDPLIRGCALAVTALGQAASSFCAMDSGAFLKYVILPCENGSDRLFDAEDESETLDSVILFLKEIVPNEARNAQEKLEQFDEALSIIGLENKMSTGRRVTLYGSDLAAIAEEWRDVARQYQSVLERRNLCVYHYTKLTQGFC